jgi:hypothetical protein
MAHILIPINLYVYNVNPLVKHVHLSLNATVATLLINLTYVLIIMQWITNAMRLVHPEHSKLSRNNVLLVPVLVKLVQKNQACVLLATLVTSSMPNNVSLLVLSPTLVI